jgi:PadR family transcriptional regulator, regulatory protein PadR
LTFVTSPWQAYVSKHKASMTTPKSDLPQGTLDLLILKVVALGPLHGYAIAQRLQQISRDVVQVQQGTLYPALHRLENRGLLAADWKLSDTGREAKFYKLTRKGRAQLESEAASWQRLADAVGLILSAAEGDPS